MLPMPTDSAGRTRLLPASLPLGHFGAAAVFQFAGWLLVASDPVAVGSFSGGMGPALAALHAFTLGMLTMTALGAGLQLLPVATVQSVRAVGLAKLIWWLLCASIATLLIGLARVDTVVAALGAVGTALALSVHAGLLAANLAGAKRARAMTAFAWMALAGLVAVIASGPALVLHYRFGWFADSRGFALAHLIVACYGYLGLLTVGFSYLLVPMFMVTRAPPEAAQRRVLLAGTLAIAAAAGIALAGWPRGWLAAPGVVGLATAAVHSRQMFGVSARRRARDGRWSLWLMRFAWAALPAGVALGLGLASYGGGAGSVATVFVALVVLGWLASFMLAVAMRILPFLATVHVRLRGGKLPLVSSLTPARSARVVAIAHPAAVLLLVAGLLAGDPRVVATAGWVGAIGACAFALFIAEVVRRARAAEKVAKKAATKAAEKSAEKA